MDESGPNEGPSARGLPGERVCDRRLMRFAGVVPEDAPDPRLESAARVRALPFPAVGLVAQPSITDTGGFGFQETGGTGGPIAVAVSRSYTLWRNPDDHADPVNLAELDEQTRTSLDTEPPWPRPAGLMEAAQLYRYPRVAVRTSWSRDASEHNTLAQQHCSTTYCRAYPMWLAMLTMRPAGSRTKKRRMPHGSSRISLTISSPSARARE